MHSEMSPQSWHKNDDCMHAVPGNWGAPKINWLRLDAFSGDCRLAIHWQLISNLQSCLFCTGAVNSCSLCTYLIIEIRSHNLFLDTSFGSRNIHLVIIKLSQYSQHWKLRPLWVSVVHGWAGVAGHHVALLSRIWLLKFSLSSCSIIDRAWWCRSYFRILR